METIKSILTNIKVEDNSIKRFSYMPYSDKITKHVWFGIAKEIIDDLKVGEQQGTIWSNLIKYVHGDEKCPYQLNNAICLMGETGSGKTQTMRIMNEYIKVDEVVYIRSGKKMPFNFRIISSKEIVSEFSMNGYDGIAKYMIIGNLCIDDLGSESSSSNHYGNRLDVIAEVIETRYNKGLLTHFTTNLDEAEIRDRYNSRVHSRIVQTCNMIIMNDKDFRLNKKHK